MGIFVLLFKSTLELSYYLFLQGFHHERRELFFPAFSFVLTSTEEKYKKRVSSTYRTFSGSFLASAAFTRPAPASPDHPDYPP